MMIRDKTSDYALEVIHAEDELKQALEASTAQNTLLAKQNEYLFLRLKAAEEALQEVRRSTYYSVLTYSHYEWDIPEDKEGLFNEHSKQG